MAGKVKGMQPSIIVGRLINKGELANPSNALCEAHYVRLYT